MAIYSGFSHEKWWFSIAMLVHQMVNLGKWGMVYGTVEYLFWIVFFPKHVHTEGFLRLQRPVLDQGAHSPALHFSTKFLHKVAFVKSWHAFQLRRLVQSGCLHSWAWHFSCKFPYKVALVKSWHAFRLRRLAQNVCLRSGLNLGCGIFPVNFCIKWLFWCLLWNVEVHFDCAGSGKMCVCVLGSIWGAAFFL